jgi:hypothetical protein
MLSGIVRLMVILVCLIGPAEAGAGRQVALVIGNSDYVSVPHLVNPRNDATAVAKHLRELGFSVTLGLDLDKAAFEQRIREFAGSLDGAEAAVFFYAGHGLQVDGRNYMVPIDADVSNEADLPFQLVAVDIALQRLASQRITTIVILDACRNNPLSNSLSKALARRANAVGQGLASIFASVGTLISFSTQPGNVALDGDGPDSPFTEALLKHIDAPNIDVLSMMRDVRREVVARTNDRQVPWDTSSLVDEFFFKKSATDQVANDGGGKQTSGSKPEDKEENEVEQRKNETDLSRVLPPDTQPVLSGKPPVQACDRIAASATDPERVAEGVTIGALDGQGGIRACRAALAKYPNTPRFEFQLARSLQKIGNYAEAANLYKSLVERGYFASLVNYGWLLNNGQGVERNEMAAVRLYLLAAQQGDAFGMFNVAMAYDSGQGLPFNPVQAADWIYAALRLGHGYSIKQMSGPATGWTEAFRIELQRLLKLAGAYDGPLNGVFGPEVWSAVQKVQSLPFAPTPGGTVPATRWDPTSIPVNAPLPR